MKMNSKFNKLFGDITKCERKDKDFDIDNRYIKIGLKDGAGKYIPNMYTWYRVDRKGEVYNLGHKELNGEYVPIKPSKRSSKQGELIATLSNDKWLHNMIHIRPVKGYNKIVADVQKHVFVAVAWGLLDDVDNSTLSRVEIHHKVKYEPDLKRIKLDAPSNLAVMLNSIDHKICDKLYDLCVDALISKDSPINISDLASIIYCSGISYNNIVDVLNMFNVTIPDMKVISLTISDLLDKYDKDEFDF